MTEITRSLDNKVPAFQKLYNLGGSSYYVALTFNPRDESWYMTLKDSGGVQTAPTVRLVTGICLFCNKRATEGIPEGDFRVIKQSTTANDGLTYDNLGQEYKLFYFDPTDVL